MCLPVAQVRSARSRRLAGSGCTGAECIGCHQYLWSAWMRSGHTPLITKRKLPVSKKTYQLTLRDPRRGKYVFFPFLFLGKVEGTTIASTLLVLLALDMHFRTFSVISCGYATLLLHKLLSHPILQYGNLFITPPSGSTQMVRSKQENHDYKHQAYTPPHPDRKSVV